MARTPEGKYQDRLIKDLETIFPDCLVLKNDPNYRQGIPDLIVMYNSRWALLEVKRSANETIQPNQDHYIMWAKGKSFGAFVFPENQAEVLEQLSWYFKQ